MNKGEGAAFAFYTALLQRSVALDQPSDLHQLQSVIEAGAAPDFRNKKGTQTRAPSWQDRPIHLLFAPP